MSYGNLADIKTILNINDNTQDSRLNLMISNANEEFSFIIKQVEGLLPSEIGVLHTLINYAVCVKYMGLIMNDDERMENYQNSLARLINFLKFKIDLL